jgi:hypothetical protein
MMRKMMMIGEGHPKILDGYGRRISGRGIWPVSFFRTTLP